MTVMGVDGCRGGWIAALGSRGDDIRTETRLHLRDLTAIDSECIIIGVDMPIGLAAQGLRACDGAARRALRPRSSTVFSAPARRVLDAFDYASACAISREMSGRAISLQTWNIVPKIREVDLVAENEPRLREVHPELSFLALNGGTPLASKHSASGRAHRTALLADIVPHVDDLLDRRSAGVAADDVLDALAVWWSARRIAQGLAIAVNEPTYDDLGREMIIRY
jgi:predicted RNase H-like nuclease